MAVGGDSFNEVIQLFAGMYSEPNTIDVDTETQALIIQLQSDVVTNPNLVTVASKIYGRLFGETMSHEIGHAILWDDNNGGVAQHNPEDVANQIPLVPNGLMNKGKYRLFQQRTGMQNTAQQSPVHPEDFIDLGIDKIGGFQAVNQGHIDRQWPVPPAHA